jgi:glycosyltransferase involved in cell wall biosynthesis
MGDMMQYVPGAKNIHYWPIDIDKIPFIGSNYDGKRPLKILHVPNHEWAKGTKYLRETLERLAANGFEFEYIQVLGKPNTEILRLMGEADIIADQFLIGWLGYTAIEAMAMGKIVLCYIRERKMLLGEDECPIISTNPDNLESVLSDIMSWEISKFEEQGIRARSYVEKYYSLSAVALRMADMYTQTAEFPSRIIRRIHRHTDKISGSISPNA